MALIDIIKHEHQLGEIVYKFPSCDLTLGSQLIVEPGQRAFLVKRGIICDQFSEGGYTLSTSNLPLLGQVVNLPYGGETPFQAEVWFVSMVNRLDMRWGTETPILLEDPKYKILIPVRAYGQYGFKISDAHLFLTKLVGNMSSFDDKILASYFRGLLLNRLTDIISKRFIRENVSILEVNCNLADISEEAQKELQPYYSSFGVEIVLFNIISINVPEDDPSVMDLKKAKNLAARMKIVGRDYYQMERSFDVLEKAAENESGSGAAFIQAGLGLGASLQLGKQLSFSTSSETPPPLPDDKYYVAINRQQQGPYSYEQIVTLINDGTIDDTTLGWKKGMSNWKPLCEFLDFPSKGQNVPPSLP